MEGTVHYLNHFPIQLLNELSFKLNTAIEAWNKWNKWVEDKLFKKEEKKKDKEKKNREEKRAKEKEFIMSRWCLTNDKRKSTYQCIYM